MTSDLHGKSLTTNALISPHINSSSTVEASSASLSSKSRERPGKSLVWKWYSSIGSKRNPSHLVRLSILPTPWYVCSCLCLEMPGIDCWDEYFWFWLWPSLTHHFGIYEALPESTAVEDNLSDFCFLSLSYLKEASNRTKYTNPEYNVPLKGAFFFTCLPTFLNFPTTPLPLLLLAFAYILFLATALMIFRCSRTPFTYCHAI